jgi:hypothetical protein
VLVGIADRVAVTGMRVTQSAAEANKVLVEIKTDDKPLRFCRHQAVVADGHCDRGHNTSSIRTGLLNRKLAITWLIRSIA